MRFWIFVLFLLIAGGSAQAEAETAVWQPAAGQVQMPVWPGAAPDAPPMPGPERVSSDPKLLVAGRPIVEVANVAVPTVTVYAPKTRNTGAAVVVFPGGGFQILAMDLEGSEVCDWLTSRGITCILLKYRVPSPPYDWRCDCRRHDLEVPLPALEDAQRAVRLARFHAQDWHFDPRKVGVLGFSAGGYLVAEVSTRFAQPSYAARDAADRESSRPDFAIAVYPGHLAAKDGTLNPNVPVSAETPPTFLVQAENDSTDGVRQSLVYYAALKAAGVPAELHLYAQGGHAFGLRPTALPITRWPELVESWLRTTGILGG